MSSWAGIELGGHLILETQNYFNMWYFRKSERQIVPDPATGRTKYESTVSGERLRRRLELDSHNLASLKREYATQIEVMKKDCRMMVEIDPRSKAAELSQVLETCCFENWQERLRRIAVERLKPESWGLPAKDYVDVLLTFMLSVEPYYFSDNTGPGGYGFP